MKKVYDWADMVIARAGATTIAEIIYFKKTAILVPYPYATDNHQELNADECVKLGLAIKVNQNNLSEEIFEKSI